MIILLGVSNMNLCSVYFAKEEGKYRFFFPDAAFFDFAFLLFL